MSVIDPEDDCISCECAASWESVHFKVGFVHLRVESESNYTELIIYKTRESSHQGVFALPALSLIVWLGATLRPNSSSWTWWKSLLWTPSKWILCLHNKIPNKMPILFTSFGMVWKLVWKQHGGTLECLIRRLADVIPWSHQPCPQTFVCLFWWETRTRAWQTGRLSSVTRSSFLGCFSQRWIFFLVPCACVLWSYASCQKKDSLQIEYQKESAIKEPLLLGIHCESQTV